MFKKWSLNEVPYLRPATLCEICEFAKFPRTVFLTEHLWGNASVTGGTFRIITWE